MHPSARPAAPIRRFRLRALHALAGALLLLVASAPTAGADLLQDREAGAAGTLALVNANIIDGIAEQPLRDATVIIEDGRIRRIAGAEESIPADARVLDLAGRWLLPGFIDVHVHIGDLASARRALESGVTTARSMGASHFIDVGMRELGRAGRISAPELLAAGYHVRPEPATALFMDEPALADLMETGVRSADAMRRMARVMVERGVDFIKTNATARAGLPQTDPREPYYGESELRVLVEEGARAGVPVAAHAHGDEGGLAAVRAGVRSIEHGTYLRPETLALMAERGTYLVPTIAIVSDLTVAGGDYDNPTLRIRGRHMLPRIRETAALAYRAGVRIVAATDTGYGPSSTVRMGHELEELVGIGLSPLEAIRAATTVAAELLGVAERTGRIAEGYEADLIVIDRNPLEDIRMLQDVLVVVHDGRVVLDRLVDREAATD